MTWRHVYPVNDFREHDTGGKNCWCHPKIDDEHSLVIHNAMDKREQIEQNLAKVH